MMFGAPVKPLYARGHVLSRTAWSAAALVCALLCGACSQKSEGQGNLGVDNPKAKASAPATAISPTGPHWQELTDEQRRILRPLAATWSSLASAHKSKWISMAQGVRSRPAAEQQKMQERMAAWAALTPVERERARLNFAETKKLNPVDRAAEWAAYQELSTEEKKHLAAKSPPNPVNASVALSPVPNDKLTSVPVTRRTGLQPDTASVTKPQIDPNTLLPKLTPPVTLIPSPDTAAPVDNTQRITIDTLSPN